MSADASTTQSNLPQELVRLMFATAAAYEEASRELGLSSQQARLLCAAGRLPTAGLGELATVMRCDRSNVSRLTERVANRGLVSRQGIESDGRVKVVRLSDEGHRTVDAFTESLESRLRAVAAELPETEQAAAARMLNTLTDAMNRGADPEEDAPQPPAGAHLLPPG